MATSEAISLIVEARRRPYEWHQLYVHHDDAEVLSRALSGVLDDPATDPKACAALLALACQLHNALRQ
jgi:hypothetical protein